MPVVRVYSTRHCGYCTAATRLLEKKGVSVETIYVDERPEQRAAMIETTGRSSVPQIFIGARHVGGYRELAALEINDQLDALLHGA
jgi:glutaredoxin 3